MKRYKTRITDNRAQYARKLYDHKYRQAMARFAPSSIQSAKLDLELVFEALLIWAAVAFLTWYAFIK